ncbi:hypothetical protein [Fusibacter sp. JL216-2]|uniref:hypothetical protein n=1 Tax=Fusibacter sp. JL216-2 TaxID=3071453 RepID=UPI003D32D670
MKNVIVILFTIMLGVYIGTNYILGDGEETTNASFKEVTEQVGTRAQTELTAIKDSKAK